MVLDNCLSIALKRIMYNWKDFSIGFLIGTVSQVTIRLSGYTILLSPIPNFVLNFFIILVYTLTRKILDPTYAPFTSPSVSRNLYLMLD